MIDMGKIILVIGGSRSGKSSYALDFGQSVPGPRTFIATCPTIDDEMIARIEAHQKERASGNWKTIEQEIDISRALATSKDSNVIVVDCLTLWINNIMYQSKTKLEDLSETYMIKLSNEVINISRILPGMTIFVSNEVGMGIIPGDTQTRLYRDLVGRCNQVFAAGADAVVHMVCGIANFIKGELKDVVT